MQAGDFFILRGWSERSTAVDGFCAFEKRIPFHQKAGSIGLFGRLRLGSVWRLDGLVDEQRLGVMGAEALP